MLKKLENGRIVFNSDFLLDRVNYNLEEKIKFLSNFPINFFYHGISSLNSNYEKKKGNLVKEQLTQMSSKKRFSNILKNQRIDPGLKGFYSNKINSEIEKNEYFKSISFSFTNLEDLTKLFKTRNSRYGICFDHEFLYSNGILEMININKLNSKQKLQLHLDSPHLVNYSPYFEYENEWRINQEIEFQKKDVIFLIVPSKDFFNISDKLKGLYRVLPSALFHSPITYLNFEIENNFFVEVNNLSKLNKFIFQRKYFDEINAYRKLKILQPYLENRFNKIHEIDSSLFMFNSVNIPYKVIQNFDEYLTNIELDLKERISKRLKK